MPTRVQLPNGSTADFPDGMSPDDIQKAIETDPTFGVAAQKQQAQPSTLQTIGQGAKDLGIGILKGAGSTANNLGKILYPDFVAKHLTGAPSQQQQEGYFAPTNTMQGVGKGLEQTAEFLAPMGAEEQLASKGAELLPQLGKLAKPVARVASAALSSGAVNKAQGGSFTGGAALGGAGGVVGEGLRAAAPVVAESALGIRNVDRRAPITPGQAILTETKGISARKIADQAKEKMGAYTTQRDALLAKAPPVDLTPARQVASDAQMVAGQRNNPETIKRVGQVSDLLNFEGGKAPAPQPAPPKVIPGFGPSAAANPPKPSGIIPTSVPALRANALKQGLGDLKTSWNPAIQNSFAEGTIGRTYGTLDKSIENSAPGASVLDTKVSSLFPVAQRANATDLNASTLQRVLGRFTRPTGALVGATGGAGYGYHEGGLPGALVGAGAGMLAPELIGSPTAQMIIARNLRTATPTVRALVGGGLQANRQSLYGTPQQ